ncbi:hypothetical protein HAX54_023639 [Datura stramonium]|uniref:Uncharacterized protein n=1 Tax=Datura stramonium TaxID=4076 RepID=A0ABS8UWP0_DATST|nr:hypothetical protein [Datura stramonium]
MYGQNISQNQTHDGESNELRNIGNERAINDESDRTNYFVSLKSLKKYITRHNCGNATTLDIRYAGNVFWGIEQTLLKDIWKLPLGKTVAVSFNSHNQAIRKDGVKLASFLGIIVKTPELTLFHINDWRSFDKNEKKKLVEFVRKKFTIPEHGEEFIIKSLGTKWKDYKCDLKSIYMKKFNTKDVLLKNKLNRIPRD